MRKPFISANWKMFKNVEEAVVSAKKISEFTRGNKGVEIMIAPAFPMLHPVYQAISGTGILLSAQDIFWEKEGAYTSRVSSSMLKSCGCSCVIVGHSECRELFYETDETVNKKIKTCIENDLIPVFCVGETDQERKAGKTESVLDKQVENGLKSFSSDQLKNLVIAYEPVWAIGTGNTAGKEDANAAHAHIRSILTRIFNGGFAEKTRILYGGSVKPNNISELMQMENIDGALVGGASLDPESFAAIVNF